MRILFVYSLQKTVTSKKPLLGQEGIQFGISYISSLLKQQGHDTRLVVIDRKYGRKNIKTIEKRIENFKPGLICFSSVHSEFEFICDIATQIKRHHPKIPLIGGGVHITLNPSRNLLEVFDSICVGEGEYPTLEYVNCLDKKISPFNIPNLWIKEGDASHINEQRDFISDIDSLPFPDRKIWQEWILEPQTRLTVLLGRGCPYNCTYCCNHKLRKVSKGEYVRLRSPENIISEIKELSINYPLVDEYFLEVETIGTDLNWLTDLCERLHEFNLQRKTKLKFGTNLRVFPKMDFELVFKRLEYAGFDSVIIGLETGNERIRREVLNRVYSNGDILKAVDFARRHGIKVGIFNMIGLPTETKEDFADTVRMNQIIMPDWHSTSIFFPYQGTQLYDYTIELGLLPKELNTKDERQKAVLSLPGFSKREIQKCFDSFHYDVYKVQEHRKIHKLIIYFIMKYLGHNTFANMKLSLIKFLYKMGLYNTAKKSGLFGVFQKS